MQHLHSQRCFLEPHLQLLISGHPLGHLSTPSLQLLSLDVQVLIRQVCRCISGLILFCFLARAWQTRSVKNQAVNSLGFAGRLVSVTIQPCCCAARAQTTCKRIGKPVFPWSSFKNRRCVWMWPTGHSLPTLARHRCEFLFPDTWRSFSYTSRHCTWLVC